MDDSIRLKTYGAFQPEIGLIRDIFTIQRSRLTEGSSTNLKKRLVFSVRAGLTAP